MDLPFQIRAEVDQFDRCLDETRREVEIFGLAASESMRGTDQALQQISAVIQQTNTALRDVTIDGAAAAAALKSTVPSMFPRVFP